jgi:Leucine-rich repeat (LRR) protein
MGRIPQSIGGLKELTHLNLKANFLIGPIPAQVYELSRLEDVDVSRNYLSGVVSPDVKYLNNLRRFNVAVNKLNGPLPYSLGDLENLEVLLMQRNQFTGSLPWGLYKLEALVKIDLTNNNLTMDSELPANICPRCERYLNKCGALGCQNCRDGVLLGCTNPDALPGRINMTDPDGPNGEDQYPLFHKCGYYYG